MESHIGEYRTAVIANTLKACQLFAGLAPADLGCIVAITAVRSLNAGEYLFHEGEPSAGFYIVQKGAINVHRVNQLGKEHVIRIFRAGESFAEATLATSAGYPGDARAVEASQVLQVQKPGFVSLLKRNPELALRMLASMSVHLRTLIAQLEDLTLRDVETRLANWIIKRCPHPESTAPATILLNNTKRVLASELGTVSETLSRTLGKFRQQGLIEVKGKALKVVCPKDLTALLRRNLGE